MAVKILLKKKWTNSQGKEYAVGTILQVIPSLGSQLIADKFGDFYEGDYPPKDKLKIELSQLNNK